MLYRYFAEDEAPKQSRLPVILNTLSELATIVKGSKEGWIAQQKQTKAKSNCGDTYDTSVSTPAKRTLPLAVESFPATTVAPPSSNRERLFSLLSKRPKRERRQARRLVAGLHRLGLFPTALLYFQPSRVVIRNILRRSRRGN